MKMCDKGKYNDFCKTKQCSKEFKGADFARPYGRYQPRWCDDSEKLRPWKEHAISKLIEEPDDNCTPWELEEQSDEELNKIMERLDEIDKMVFPPTETEKNRNKWEDRVRRKRAKLREKPCVPKKYPFSLFNRCVEEETCDETRFKRVRTPRHGIYWAAPVRPLNPCTHVAKHLMQPPDASTTRRCVCGKQGGCHPDKRGCNLKSCCHGKPNQDMCEASYRQHGFNEAPETGRSHHSNYYEQGGYEPTVHMEKSNYRSETTIHFQDEDTEAEDVLKEGKHDKGGKKGKDSKKDNKSKSKGGDKSNKSEKSHGGGKSDKSHGGKKDKSKGGNKDKPNQKGGKSSHDGESSHGEDSDALEDMGGEEMHQNKSHDKSKKSQGGKGGKSEKSKKSQGGKGGKSEKSKNSKKGEDKKSKKSQGGKKEKEDHHDDSPNATISSNSHLQRSTELRSAHQNSDYSKITRTSNLRRQKSSHSRLHSHQGSDFSTSPLSSTYIKPDNDRTKTHYAAPIRLEVDQSHLVTLDSEITYFGDEVPHRKLSNTNPFIDQH